MAQRGVRAGWEKGAWGLQSSLHERLRTGAQRVRGTCQGAFQGGARYWRPSWGTTRTEWPVRSGTESRFRGLMPAGPGHQGGGVGGT